MKAEGLNPTSAPTPELPLTEELKGREALDDIEAVTAQIDLMKRMLPEDIKTIFKPSNGETVGGIEDDLFMRWYEKYAVKFADFCDEQAENPDLINRLKTQTLTFEDYEILITYLQTHEEVESPFLTPNDVTELVLKYGH